MSVNEVLKLLIELFVPIVSKFLQDWLRDLLTKAAKNLYGDLTKNGIQKIATAEKIIDEAIELTPKIRIFRRSLLRKIKESIRIAFDEGVVDQSDSKEIKQISKICEV